MAEGAFFVPPCTMQIQELIFGGLFYKDENISNTGYYFFGNPWNIFSTSHHNMTLSKSQMKRKSPNRFPGEQGVLTG